MQLFMIAGLAAGLVAATIGIFRAATVYRQRQIDSAAEANQSMSYLQVLYSE